MKEAKAMTTSLDNLGLLKSCSVSSSPPPKKKRWAASATGVEGWNGSFVHMPSL